MSLSQKGKNISQIVTILESEGSRTSRTTVTKWEYQWETNCGLHDQHRSGQPSNFRSDCLNMEAKMVTYTIINTLICVYSHEYSRTSQDQLLAVRVLVEKYFNQHCTLHQVNGWTQTAVLQHATRVTNRTQEREITCCMTVKRKSLQLMAVVSSRLAQVGRDCPWRLTKLFVRIAGTKRFPS